MQNFKAKTKILQILTRLFAVGQASVTVADMGSTTSGDNANIPLIIGVVAGSLALLLSIVVIVVCLRRKSDSSE